MRPFTAAPFTTDSFWANGWRPTGLIYPMFSKEKCVREVDGGGYDEYYVSCDYGTVNPMSMGLWGIRENKAFRIREYYYSSRDAGGQKTDEEYYTELLRLVKNKDIKAVVCDPSAASFMTCVRRHGSFRVIPAKNSVAEGISLVADALREGRLIFFPLLRRFHQGIRTLPLG